MSPRPALLQWGGPLVGAREVTMRERRLDPWSLFYRWKAPWRFAVAALACAIIFTPISQASITGSISGTVRDPSGALMPGATVLGVNMEWGVGKTVPTVWRGFFRCREFPIGE